MHNKTTNNPTAKDSTGRENTVMVTGALNYRDSTNLGFFLDDPVGKKEDIFYMLGMMAASDGWDELDNDDRRGFVTLLEYCHHAIDIIGKLEFKEIN